MQVVSYELVSCSAHPEPRSARVERFLFRTMFSINTLDLFDTAHPSPDVKSGRSMSLPRQTVCAYIQVPAAAGFKGGHLLDR